MADTVTVNYNLVKPEISGSPTTWGNKLNANMDLLDGLVKINEVGNVPVGAMLMWATASAPTNWLVCDGRSLSTAAPYDKLFAILSYTYGGSGTSFNLPNLAQKFPMGAGTIAASGGAATVTLDSTMVPAHAHTVTDPGHQHYINLTQTPHAHSDSGHAHLVQPAAHAHGASLMRFIGSGGTLGVGVTPNNVSTGNTDSAQSAQVATDARNVGIQPINANIGITARNGNGGGNWSDVGQAANGAAMTTSNFGGGAAHNNLPPYLQINFIIKYA